MPVPQELKRWQEEVSSAFPTLSQPQAQVLSLYSYGMAMTQRCGQTVVCVFLALLLQLKPCNVRQRLKEFIYEAGQKRGVNRREVKVEAQFAPLLEWVLKHWSDKRKLVLGVDITYLKDRHMILAISVLLGQTAIPVAWKVVGVNAKGEWHPLWVQLCAQLAVIQSQPKQVLLLFDRGLYSKRLFNVVRQHGWHPVMRIREQGLYKRHRSKNWQALKHLAYRGMAAKAFKVQCFKGNPLAAYLWVEWDARQDEACLFLSDLSPKQVKGNPYPLRMWIEAGFKDWKRGGFRLEQCKTFDPQRLTRLIFVLALALFYLIRSGYALLLSPTLPSNPLQRLSCVTLGWLHLLVTAIQHTSSHFSLFPPYSLPPFPPPQKNTYP